MSVIAAEKLGYGSQEGGVLRTGSLTQFIRAAKYITQESENWCGQLQK